MITASSLSVLGQIQGNICGRASETKTRIRTIITYHSLPFPLTLYFPPPPLTWIISTLFHGHGRFSDRCFSPLATHSQRQRRTGRHPSTSFQKSTPSLVPAHPQDWALLHHLWAVMQSRRHTHRGARWPRDSTTCHVRPKGISSAIHCSSRCCRHVLLIVWHR